MRTKVGKFMRTKVGKQYNKLCLHMHGVAKLPLKCLISYFSKLHFFINLSPLYVVSCKIRENDRKSNLFGPEKETKEKKSHIMSTVGPTPKERTNVQMWRIQSLYLYFYTLFSRKKCSLLYVVHKLF